MIGTSRAFTQVRQGGKSTARRNIPTPGGDAKSGVRRKKINFLHTLIRILTKC
jgi:hypothetical protein